MFKFPFQKSITTIFSFLFLAFTFIGTTTAAPGDLDASFGSGGIARAPLSRFSADQAQAAALQPDGKIVIAGSSNDGLRQNFIVTRVNPNGTLDTSFGLGGKSPRIPGFFNNFATAVIIQPDGKIVAGGFSRIGIFNNFTLVRYNANGSVDTSFGLNGVVQTLVTTNSNSMLNGLAMQPDGKIIAVGHTYANVNSPLSIAIARYNPDGSPDTSFDGDGKLFVNFDQNTGNSARAVVLQPDGKILVGGQGRIAARTDCAIIRLHGDGSFDNSFDGDGRVTRQVGTNAACSVAGLAVQPDGKIAAAVQGRITIDDPDVIAMRFNPDGSIDNSFDGDGIASANVANDGVTGIVLQPDGKIVIAGYASTPAPVVWFFIAVRFNADGSPDTSFDGDGKVSTQVAPGFSQERAALLQPDGKIVLAGFGFNTNQDISLVRYNPNGSLDASFDGDGISHVELGNGIDVVLATAIQPDGKILASGYSFGGLFLEVTVARFNSNGTLDTSFGDNGSVRTPFGERSSFGREIAVQPDGKIVVGVSEGNPQYTLIRYNADGTPDSNFGTAGVLTLPLQTLNGHVHGLAIQPDGKIVAGGYSFSELNERDISVIRLNNDGSLDPTFGTGGVAVTPDTANNDTISSLVLQPDGKIVLAGTSDNQITSRFVVARYNNNGTPDTSFGGGKVYTTFNSGSSEGANAVRIQADGKIVAAGYANGSFALARYNTDGSLDTSFDGDGRVTTLIEANNFNYQIYGLGIQQSGKIVVSGTASVSLFLDGAVFRYNANGSLDNTFGNAGKVITHINNSNSEYYALSLQADDKIVVGGYSSNGANDDFTLVRYLSGQAVATQRALFDFDGDNKSDISVFRPSDGVWYLNQSQAGFNAVQFGISTDKIAPADYDGDGKTDLGVFRDGVWYLLRSQTGFAAIQFGAAGDLPRPADFDGDGKADLVVFRPSDGTWYLLRSQAGFTGVQFGTSGDIPVPSDFDGDGKADINVYRPSTGSWYRLNSSNGQFVGIQFGVSEDLPTPADFDGDGKSDVSVFRPSNGTWYRLNSSNDSFTGIQFGATGDAPTAGDFDGDGKADISVFRPSNGSWYRINSTNSQFIAAQFGANGDKAVPSAHLP